MANLGSLGEIVETDVLIVGHSAAGLACATAKQAEPRLRVLAVDKACAGFGGQGRQGRRATAPSSRKAPRRPTLSTTRAISAIT